MKRVFLAIMIVFLTFLLTLHSPTLNLVTPPDEDSGLMDTGTQET